MCCRCSLVHLLICVRLFVERYRRHPFDAMAGCRHCLVIVRFIKFYFPSYFYMFFYYYIFFSKKISSYSLRWWRREACFYDITMIVFTQQLSLGLTWTWFTWTFKYNLLVHFLVSASLNTRQMQTFTVIMCIVEI